jgi:hypothetical protein
MMAREPLEHAFTARGYVHAHEAMILRRSPATNQAAPRHAVHQLDRAVVVEQKPFGEAAYGRFAGGQPAKSEQQLMLLGLEASGAGDTFAEVQEAPKLVPEFCQGLLAEDAGSMRFHRQNYIVSRYVCPIAMFVVAIRKSVGREAWLQGLKPEFATGLPFDVGAEASTH